MTVTSLLGFIDGSPSPYHAVDNVATRLAAAGFRLLDERQPWTVGPGDRGMCAW